MPCRALEGGWKPLDVVGARAVYYHLDNPPTQKNGKLMVMLAGLTFDNHPNYIL